MSHSINVSKNCLIWIIFINNMKDKDMTEISLPMLFSIMLLNHENATLSMCIRDAHDAIRRIDRPVREPENYAAPISCVRYPSRNHFPWLKKGFERRKR